MQLARQMDLKELLKAIKLNEGTISTILGVIVVLVVGLLIINYFRNLGSRTETQITSTSTENTPGRQHTVTKGETLWSIAQKYYNSGYNWANIARENNLTSPNAIEVGQVLTIPVVPSSAASPQLPQLEKPALTPDTEYTVVRGDHLWSIAVRTYDDGYQWVKIWRANKNVKNPNLIYPDQKLTLPQ